MEVDEFVRQGDVLAVLDSIDIAEVAAQVPMARIGALIRSEITISALEPNTEAMRRALGLSARVWLRAEGLEVMWPARVARMSDTIDPETRTVGVIVEVDGPYRDVRPGVRPPLLKGLFVEVELLGRARPKQLVIPRNALHIDQVYLLDAENRLRKQPVDLLLTQPEFVVVKAGLTIGGSADRLGPGAGG